VFCDGLGVAVAVEFAYGGLELVRCWREGFRELWDALGASGVSVGGIQGVLAAFCELEGAVLVERYEATLEEADELWGVDAYAALVVDGA